MSIVGKQTDIRKVFLDAIIQWNIFITHFTDMPSFYTLNSHIMSRLRPSQRSIFNIHDQTGLRCLFQNVRIGLSQLRCHKRRHNFIDTSSNICVCNTGVDNNHILLKCLFYATQRSTELL